ncbi:MAG: hypothetical protein BGO05_05485 [Rhizobiales bacterium 63-7]|nr:MAG: hypothetical protein BGO05_05485 [Rhizobiales bacterium 63-7]
MPNPSDGYAVTVNFEISVEVWNAALPHLAGRVGVLETIVAAGYTAAQEAGTAMAQDIITNSVAPQIADIQALIAGFETQLGIAEDKLAALQNGGVPASDVPVAAHGMFGPGTDAQEAFEAVSDALDFLGPKATGAQQQSEKNQPNGYLGLGANGKASASYIEQTVGTVIYVAAGSAPDATYLPLDGAAYLQSAYPALFAKLGTSVAPQFVDNGTMALGGGAGTATNRGADYNRATNILGVLDSSTGTKVMRSADAGLSWTNPHSFGSGYGSLRYIPGANRWYCALSSTNTSAAWATDTLVMNTISVNPNFHGALGSGFLFWDTVWGELAAYQSNTVYFCTNVGGLSGRANINLSESFSKFINVGAFDFMAFSNGTYGVLGIRAHGSATVTYMANDQSLRNATITLFAMGGYAYAVFAMTDKTKIYRSNGGAWSDVTPFFAGVNLIQSALPVLGDVIEIPLTNGLSLCFDGSSWSFAPTLMTANSYDKIKLSDGRLIAARSAPSPYAVMSPRYPKATQFAVPYNMAPNLKAYIKALPS